MADNWWGEETKKLIVLWRDFGIQEKLSSMHNKKRIWDQISAEMIAAGHVRTGQQCRTKINNLKQKYRKIRDWNRVSGNNRKEWEYFDAMDAVLGCKPSSEPLVVVDSNLSESPCARESTNETTADAFRDVFDDQLGGGDAEVASILSESQEEGMFDRITDSETNSLSPPLEANDLNPQKVVRQKGETPPLDRKSKADVNKSTDEGNSLKRKKPREQKADKITEALTRFAQIQNDQQQLFLQMEERRSQREYELEEKRMKLEHEQDKRREEFMMEMMKIMANNQQNK